MVKNKILIITGMHRSGTSLITHWLHTCGLHIGDELLGADTGNENGHFEDLDFLNSHKALLKGRKLPDNGFTANPFKQLSDEEKDKLRDIISYKNAFNQQWGWKDPRTCLFLDVYNELIPGAFYFVVLRDYQSVISSLVYRMYKQSEKKYASKKGISGFIWKYIKKKKRMEVLYKKHCQRFLQIWIAYNQAILQHIKRLPVHNYLVTDYSNLFENDKPIFEYLLNTWGFTLHFFDFKNIYKAGQLNTSFNIDPYIRDKSLISNANYIEELLRQKSIFRRLKETLAAT
jgi:hypothetical protein